MTARRTDGVNASLSPKAEEDPRPSSASDREFSIAQSFCSMQASRGLGEALSHWGGWSY